MPPCAGYRVIAFASLISFGGWRTIGATVSDKNAETGGLS
jgi:hypothetical protein